MKLWVRTLSLGYEDVRRACTEHWTRRGKSGSEAEARVEVATSERGPHPRQWRCGGDVQWLLGKVLSVGGVSEMYEGTLALFLPLLVSRELFENKSYDN